ncbi:hypothetical protein GC088_02925 [Arthrobacter sp. JZ12]|uniref:hypothetical protein n=1 Tax=Arthrobacter sp. JZ12 TaxID=2654190 RepID=UPI002B497516|nr:hypothetical protein [Arthrobacter sp. JZ12]WRH24154.1 hypothetical protein GC088_02925 [Arthrobacter sp. JZ12]
MRRTLPKAPILLASLPLFLTACGGTATSDAGSEASAEATPHGYIAGAQENAEPQKGLFTLNRKNGEAQLMSLLDDETVDAGTFGAVNDVAQDGRYAFLTTGDAVEVFDTGAWTVEHGDHDHYYSAEPGSVGTIELPGAGTVAGDGKQVAVFSDSEGYASLYTHEDLDAGEITEKGRITTTPHDGLVVPYQDHFLASVPADGTTATSAANGVEVRTADDETVLPAQSCPGLSSHAKTRVGVVFACTDGALLITEDDGEFSAEHIPYPTENPTNNSAEPATALEHRPGSNELAGTAGDAGVWHLNVSDRRWTLLKTPVPAISASAVGDEQRVLAVGVDGSLLSLDPETGELLAQTALLEPAEEGNPPQLRIDTSRAYVSDPAASKVHEVDYADNLRVARTFEVPAADLMLETGL